MSGSDAPAPDSDNVNLDRLPLRVSKEIQGNILAGFNKDHQWFLLLRFADQERGRAWLGAVTPDISTTRDVASFNEAFSGARRQRSGRDPEGDQWKKVWLGLGLTAAGLVELAASLAEDLRGFLAFRDGPADPKRAAQLGDQGPSDPSGWVFGGPSGPPIHAILTIAADDPHDLKNALDRQRALVAEHAVEIVWDDHSGVLPGALKGHEHFGFKDAISQPGVRGFDFPDSTGTEVLDQPGRTLIAPGEFVVGWVRTDGKTLSAPWWVQNGSFQVFRRLAQNVKGWRDQLDTRRSELVTRDPNNPVTTQWLSAKLAGRWPSGAPLAKTPLVDQPALANDVDFEFGTNSRGVIPDLSMCW